MEKSDPFRSSVNNEYQNRYTAILITLNPVFYIAQHWIFAFSYLKIALVFKLAFTKKSDASLTQYKRREKIVNYVGSLSFIFFFLLYIANEIAFHFEKISIETSITITATIDLVMTPTMIVILAFSLFRIRQYTKMLKANKVFANEKLMVAHLLCFCATYFFLINDDVMLYATKGVDY